MSGNVVESHYEVFIEGETIDLVIPNRHAIDNDGWHCWFNKPDITRFLEQGIFPNTREDQYAYFERIMADDSRIDLLIRPKDKGFVIGVTSLSQINWQDRSAHHALVIGSKERDRDSLFHGLEAKARMAEHAFEVMGLQRVWGGQPVGLEDWQRYITLFGFRPEGIWRNGFRKGYMVYDIALNACLLEDYLKIKEARGGDYWPGKKRLLELMRRVPKDSIVDKISSAIDKTVAEYLRDVPLA